MEVNEILKEMEQIEQKVKALPEKAAQGASLTELMTDIRDVLLHLLLRF